MSSTIPKPTEPAPSSAESNDRERALDAYQRLGVSKRVNGAGLLTRLGAA
jgi:hypothetical protein